MKYNRCTYKRIQRFYFPAAKVAFSYLFNRRSLYKGNKVSTLSLKGESNEAETIRPRTYSMVQERQTARTDFETEEMDFRVNCVDLRGI